MDEHVKRVFILEDMAGNSTCYHYDECNELTKALRRNIVSKFRICGGPEHLCLLLIRRLYVQKGIYRGIGFEKVIFSVALERFEVKVLA